MIALDTILTTYRVGKFIALPLHVINYVLLLFTGATARTNGAFGRGSGPVFLADIACGGLEGGLFDCTRGELEGNDCSHSLDAGVVCLAGKILLNELIQNNGVMTL